MISSIQRVGLIFCLALIATLSSHRPAVVTAQTDEEIDYQAAALAIFNGMSIEERVGQLFLVTFEGDSASFDSDIADLILNYRVGGVVLKLENDNITGYGNPENTPFQIIELANSLQQLALLGPETAVSGPADLQTESAVTTTPFPEISAIPLFIATNQEGDGYPNSAILNGLTEIPNNMAVGATWQPNFAQKVGEILGRELSAIGVNMLLGPSLDVLENPVPGSPSDMSTRTLGGDPYWVGLLGRAYTQGLHLGSNDRLAVVAKHFPGNGSSDRPVDQEVPTVRKSLEQLKQIELAPFFAVTNDSNGRSATTDALLATHIRYQGFQGNIRATTAPVSFDPQALNTLMALPEFTGWRQNGGLIVSDSLGVRAVKRFYDDTEQEFPHRLVTKDAFLAGNDLLYLSDFAAGDSGYGEQLNNIRDTVVWFREKYLTDQTFQLRVDEAVMRILQLKLRLYNNDFSLENILVDRESFTAIVGQGSLDLLVLAQEAITLISPSQAELAERLASPPGIGDTITIFTDVREVQQCSFCEPEALISRTAVQERILALYGPRGSNQVQPNQISSFTFPDLQAFLDEGPGPIFLPTPDNSFNFTDANGTPLPPNVTPSPAPTPTTPPSFLVQEALRETDWIIFAMLDGAPESRALSEFLALRPDIIRETRVIVFAYNAPYYLDTTESSKLTAYFGVYSKTEPFIDASVRALFLELPLSGASPVDIEGISYDLFTKTQPDPGQVIELYITEDDGIHAPPSEAPLEYSVGDTLHLQTGIIRDHNGHPVPDGTLVEFIQQDRIQGLINIIAGNLTTNGVAQLDYVLEARTGPGKFRITAESGEAVVSQEVDILIEGGAQVAIIVPTLTPTATFEPTPTATSTAMPTETRPATPTAVPTPTVISPEEPAVRIALSEFQMLLAMISGITSIAIITVFISRRTGPIEENIAWPFWGVAGGLILYNYYALGLPGTAVIDGFGSWAGLLTTILGGVAGILLYRLSHN